MGTKHDKALVSAQLRVGDTDLSTHRIGDIQRKITAAVEFARVARILYQPTRNQDFNQRILDFCRERGLEVFLWYPVLGDNDYIPNSDELMTDAFGSTTIGDSGAWSELARIEDSFFAACPTNRIYSSLLFDRCRRMLAEYDGLFVDTIGYPLPSLGLEGLFTCFCTNCVQLDTRVPKWRERVYEMKERFTSATDADLDRWGTYAGLLEDSGLADFDAYRTGLITRIVKRYADMVHDLGKPIGADVLCPAFAQVAGHDLRALGGLVDWVKPRIYCHTFGPSSIPLEYYCMTMGLQSWGKRLSIPAIMNFVSRSTLLEKPANLDVSTTTHLPETVIADQTEKTVAASVAPVYAGIECSLHPEYETTMDDKTVLSYLDASSSAAGVVLSWNLLFIPDSFLRLIRF